MRAIASSEEQEKVQVDKLPLLRPLLMFVLNISQRSENKLIIKVEVSVNKTYINENSIFSFEWRCVWR